MSGPEAYHRWYYETAVWKRVTFLGIPCQKSVLDLWNYQELLFERQPSLVVELGTYRGGSALFFAQVLRGFYQRARVLTVDRVRRCKLVDPNIELLISETTHPRVVQRIGELREELPGPLFVILDSDHHQEHVLAEMLSLREVLVARDYLVVEDGNINGHPVLPNYGPGPLEAIAEYEQQYPNDYWHDRKRENKFGFTFAPNGFLVRN